MPLLQRLSKKVGCRIWDAIKAKLKELTGREKIDKTLVDYVFVLFDPSNSPQLLHAKLVDFLGDKTDPFVEWFAKVVSQVDNQVSKGDKEASGKDVSVKKEQSPTEAENVEKAAEACLDGILPQTQKKERSVEKAAETERHLAADEETHDAEAAGTSRRSSRHERDRSERSQDDRHKDHGEQKGASRMLSKAAQDAVKSVQAVGESSSRAHAPPAGVSPRDKTKPHTSDVSKEHGMHITVQGNGLAPVSPVQPETKEDFGEPITPESPELEVEAAQLPPPVAMEAHPIMVVTRAGQKSKRSFEEAMEVETFHHNPVVVTAANNVTGPTNRFVYASAQGPLVVPEKETEENEPMNDDSNSTPGLLVVMPATTHDPLSRIKLGNEDRMHGDQFDQYDPNFRFNGNPDFHRPPFAHLPHGQFDYWEEPMQEDFHSGNPAKRFRKAPAAIDPSLIMCRFLPRCAKRADVCPYYHPACRNGKYCRFGDSCVYDHSGAPAPNAGGAKQLRTKKPICRFYPNCTQPQCHFLHKQSVPCSFGTYCRTGPAKCLFLHPEDILTETAGDSASINDLQIPDYDDDSELADADGEQDGSNLSYEELAPVQT